MFSHELCEGVGNIWTSTRQLIHRPQLLCLISALALLSFLQGSKGSCVF